MASGEHITAVLARWAATLRFEQIPPAAVHHAKRLLLDAIGCALGGYRQADVQICLSVLEETAARGPATLIGSARKVDPISAALANALMIRVLDYNDVYWHQDPCHPSDLIPAALACCERMDSDGEELIVGAVLGYELEMRLCEAAYPGIRERGWHHATFTALAAPAVAGRCLRLDAERIQHAIGISGSRMATFGAVAAGQLSMMKNTVDALATQSGVLAALLAERGFSGPAHVIDGKEGLTRCLGPEWRLGVLSEGLGESWRIERCAIKAYPTQALTHGPIAAVLHLVTRHNLDPAGIAKIHVRMFARAVDMLADPEKYDPRTKETADHSLPYCIAAAIVDRRLTPAQFEQARIDDPVIRAQLAKVEVVPDAESDRLFPELQRSIVEIRMSDGRSYHAQLDRPKGGGDTMGDEEVEQKFDALAEGVLSERARRRLKEAVWNVEQPGMLRELMTLCKVGR